MNEFDYLKNAAAALNSNPDKGHAYVDVYPMKKLEDADTLCTRDMGEPDFYDVVLWPSPTQEWEDLTLEQATEQVEKLEAQYPGITVNWIEL